MQESKVMTVTVISYELNTDTFTIVSESNNKKLTNEVEASHIYECYIKKLNNYSLDALEAILATIQEHYIKSNFEDPADLVNLKLEFVF